ncbi:MAG: hypothetical protein II949_11055, partial [Prevotella sp.]|nr:hypothetical protein [Prevotella sp.]
MLRIIPADYSAEVLRIIPAVYSAEVLRIIPAVYSAEVLRIIPADYSAEVLRIIPAVYSAEVLRIIPAVYSAEVLRIILRFIQRRNYINSPPLGRGRGWVLGGGLLGWVLPQLCPYFSVLLAFTVGSAELFPSLGTTNFYFS